MKGTPTIPAQRTKRTLSHAFTLVEVMVSMIILGMSMTGLTGLFLQNLRYSTWQTNNVHITNTSFGIADQIKNMGPDAIWQIYQAADTASPITISAITVDPTDLADGYKTLTLNVNKKETAVTSGGTATITSTVAAPAWNKVTLKLGRLTTSPSIPVEYWITLRRNHNAPNTTPAFDVLELTLIYRWSVAGKSTNTLNQIQLTFPAPNCTFN